MFEVLTFVYENYDAGDIGQEPRHLERRLKGVGFESDEIEEALTWLQGMDRAAHPKPLQPWLVQPDKNSSRVYPLHELNPLGVEAIGFITFLESAGVLPAYMRELVIDRALAAKDVPVSLDDLKIIILMVYWRFGQEPDALVLDELCNSPVQRVIH